MGLLPRFSDMKIIGLTGPSGAGKGTVAALFAGYGIPSIDTDQAYHALLLPPSPCLNALVLEFGKDILDDTGNLDRKRLSRLVFSSDANAVTRRSRLNQITHSYIIRECADRLSALHQKGYPAVILDAPLLVEAGLDRECDAVIAVIAEPNLRLERLCSRDHLTPGNALARIAAQPNDSFYRSHAKYCITNSGTPEALLPTVLSIIEELALMPIKIDRSQTAAIGKGRQPCAENPQK